MSKATFIKTLKTITLITCALLIQTNVYSSSDKKIDELVRVFIKENKVPGMSVAIINKSTISILNFGFANDLKKTPVTKDTIYTIASFSKTVTALLTAIAAQEERLKLDDSFTKYIPDLHNDNNLSKITLSELLGHVSSFPFDFKPRPANYASIIEGLNHFQADRTPGSKYNYSNAGIGTLGFVLQNVYKEPYQDILNQKMLIPLHMTSTNLHVPEEQQKLIALGHDKNNQPVPYNPINEAWFAAASLTSTISDMGKYLNAQINPESLNNKTLLQALATVHENRYCFADKISCEQLAWQAHLISHMNTSQGDTYFIDFDTNGMPIFDQKEIKINDDFNKNKLFIDKTGSGYGMSSYMAYVPEERVGVVILINKNIGDERIRLGRDILKGMMINKVK